MRTSWKTGVLAAEREPEEMEPFSSTTSESPHLCRERHEYRLLPGGEIQCSPLPKTDLVFLEITSLHRRKPLLGNRLITHYAQPLRRPSASVSVPQRTRETHRAVPCSGAVSGLLWIKVNAHAKGTSTKGPLASSTQLAGFCLSVLETQPHYTVMGELSFGEGRSCFNPSDQPSNYCSLSNY